MNSDIQSQLLDPGLAILSYQNSENQESGENEYDSGSSKNKNNQLDHRLHESQDYLYHNNRSDYDYDDPEPDYEHEPGEETEASDNKYPGRGNVYKALIKDEVQYKYLLHSRITKERIEGRLKYLDTFPEDPATQRSWVKRIFEAILNLEGIIDKETKYHNSSSQAARRVRDGYYPDIEIEKTAWNLMLNARDAQIGVRLIDKYHGVKIEDPVRNGVGVFRTWADRMEAIINTLRVSKAACKQLMDPHYIDRIVVSPNAERQMKKNNKRINTERDIQNQLGRKLLDLKIVPVADVEREVEKLQHIKEAHRLSAPPKTPRVKKELHDDPSIVFRTARTPLLDQKKKPSSRKRKPTSQKKSQSAQIASDEELEDLDFVPDNEKELPQYSQDLPPSKRQRFTRSRTNSTMTVGYPAENQTDFGGDVSIIGGMCAHQKFSPDFISSNNDPCISEASTFDFNRQDQHFDRLHINHSISSFQFDQSIDIFQTNHPVSFQQGSLNGSAQTPQQAINFEPKMDKRYSEIICDLLSISADFAVHLSLKDLRIYAHAYNSRYFLCPWNHPELGMNTAKGCFVYDNYTKHSCHISNFFPRFTGIALAREDVDSDLNIIPGTEISHLFSTEGNQLMDQALGVVENPCGLSLPASFYLTKKNIY